jgi:phosphohistidine phosphatase
MRIYLVRHAEAIDRAGTMPDAARYLTARGRVSFRGVAARFREAGARPLHIFTSPLVRAVQTAEILSEGLRHEGAVIVAPQLSPGFDEEGLNVILDECPGADQVALVGHEPDLGRIVTRMLSLPRACALAKGAVAALDVADAGSRLRAEFSWLLTGERRIEELSDLSG